MLERHQTETKHFGFLVSIEIALDGGPSISRIQEILADAVAWVEGTGKVDVECLGEIEVYEKEPKCGCYPWDGIHAVDCPLTVKGSDAITE